MLEKLAVLNGNAVNRYGYLFPVEALESALNRSWEIGVPSCISHDLHRLIGWTRGLSLYIEPVQEFNLKAVDDLEGKYQKADKAGITFIKKGDIGLVVKNDKGVVLNLKAVKKGLELDLVSEGLTVLKVT
jgi:hypothetical protein